MRKDWMDVSKGVGIILVVLGHILQGLISAKILTSVNEARTVEYGLYLFHMPLFFFLAGLNVKRSLKKGRQAFLKNKVWTIIYPYILWSWVQGGIQIALMGDVRDPVKPIDLLQIGWSPFGQFWFLYALFACHLFAAFFPLNMTALTIATVIASSLFGLPIFGSLALVKKILYGLAFYLPGVMVADKIESYLSARLWWVVVWASLFTLAAFVNGRLTDFQFSSTAALPAAWLGIWTVITFGNTIGGILKSVLAYIGRLSMTIFIFHIIAGAGTRVVLKKLGIFDGSIHLIAGVSIGVLAPIIMHIVFDRLGLSQRLGLAAPIPKKIAPEIPNDLK